MPPFRLRPATSSDLPLLSAVHQSAISTFAQIPKLVAECSLPALPLELLQTFDVVVAVDISTTSPLGQPLERTSELVHSSASPTPQPQNGDWALITRNSVAIDAPPLQEIKGFVALRLLDGFVFVAMISVREPDQKEGVGTALLAHAIAQSKTRGYKIISLTTFKDVPWNGK